MADLGEIGDWRNGLYVHAGYVISGTVLDAAGQPARRFVTCLSDVGESVTASIPERFAYSDPATGAYAIPCGTPAPRMLIVWGEPGRNALVHTGVVPL